MRLLILALTSLLAVSAHAYQDGTYRCKNTQGLPDNVYKISTISVGGEDGPLLPFIEATRHFRNGSGVIVQSKIKGLATLLSMADDKDTLMLGTIRLEFHGDRFMNCAL